MKKHAEFSHEAQTDLEEVTVRYHPKKTSHSEYTADPGYAAGSTLSGQEEEAHTHKNQNSVKVVPSITKESLRTQGNNSEDQLDDKDPHEDIVKKFGGGPNFIGEEECIDEGENDEDGDGDLEDPMLYNFLELETGINKLPEPDPALDVIKSWRHHGTIVHYSPSQVHKLPHLDETIIVLIDFDADVSNKLHIPDFMPIEEVQKFDKYFEIQIGIILSQGHKGDYQGVLLTKFVCEDELTVG